MAHPGGFNPNQAPQQWRPGMDPPPQFDPNSAPMQEGTGPPPPVAANDPAYPPMAGYENVGFGRPPMMLPPPPMPPPQGNPPPMTFTDLANLDEEACRAAMIQHVSEHCCYGSKPAKEMQVSKTKGITALHYTLETFGEGRTTKPKRVPYMGGPVDGPENGPPPPPWAIPCQPNQMFTTHVIKIDVPHTSVVLPCNHCKQRGWNECWRCHMRGKLRCNTCDGRGWNHGHDPHGNPVHDHCNWCHGTGWRSCNTCGGDGRITCKECEGYRMLRCFIQLKVAFTNHQDDFILEGTDMPDELIRTVGGTVVFQDQQQQVWPITSYPVPEINNNSQRLVASHRGQWPSERILNQRQTLRGVPVTEVAYTWDDVSTRYWVYGNERRVYAPDYPQQCCCGCSVL